MGQYTSYYLYQRYEQREGQDPIPCTPNVYSVDAEGTMEKVIKMENDPDCGYTPPPTEPIYRWYQIPITQDYICADCPSGETIYRWLDSGTTCIGYDKWQRSIQQYSEDEGETWYNVDPPVYSATSLIEADSEDCGYVPPTPTSYKFSATYVGGTSYSAACDSNTTLTTEDTKPSGYEYTAMTSAVIGDCVTSLGRNAFSGCTSLSSYTLGSGVTSIGDSAFRSCSGLTSATIPSGVTSIGNWAFNGCTSLTSVTIPSGVTTIGVEVFRNCSGLTSVTIQSGVTTIGEGTFYHCYSLTSITIPNSVTTIGAEAFFHCYSLTSITIPNSVTTIGAEAFYFCTSLASITIPDSVTSIGNRTFNGCTSLTSVTIGASITTIGNDAFYECGSLTSITCLATTPATLGTQVFDDTNNCPIYVPAASVSTYKSANRWSAYASRIQAIP